MYKHFLVCLLATISWNISATFLVGQLAFEEVEVFAPLAPLAPAPLAPPAAAADADAVAIATNAAPADNLIIQRGQAKWKYWDAAEAPEPTWTESDFDDSQWKEGQAPLGYGDSFVKTKISFGDDDQKKHPVAFFRHKFRVAEEDASAPAIAKIRMDDAVVVYVNAKEVYRFNLPDGPVDHRTMAKVSLKPENRDWTFVIDAEHLQAGDNLIAVSVHQRGDNSSDLLLDLELKPADEPAAKLARVVQANEAKDLAAGTTQQAKSDVLVSLHSKDWKYWDQEERPPGEWTALAYDDAPWSTRHGPAGLR